MRRVETDRMGTPLPTARHRQPAAHRGFTLVEVLVAATITLLLMGGVVSMFGYVTNKVTDSRAVMEMSDQLRTAKQRLQLDLMGATAPTIPPLNPDNEQGYFEVMEGPIGPVFYGYTTGANGLDYSVGDNDDVLMFTSHGVNNEQFIGRCNASITDLSAGIMRSPLAEICWFLRGGTLYRRVLLIKPQITPAWIGTSTSYYTAYDLSMRQEHGAFDARAVPVQTQKTTAPGQFTYANAYPIVLSNSLGDLTKRENRYGHQPQTYPYDMRFWNRPMQNANSPAAASRPGWGLPTIYESCSGAWPFPWFGPPMRYTPYQSYVNYQQDAKFSLGATSGDFQEEYVIPVGTGGKGGSFGSVQGGALALHGLSWNWGYSGWGGNSFANSANGSTATLPGFGYGRYDDVVMNHVLSFDIKVWDPGAPVFQVQSTSANGTTAGPFTAVLPGDPGYITALSRFDGNPSPTNKQVTLSSLGAYVDLNYMYPIGDRTGTYWASKLATYAQNLYGNRSATVTGYNYFYPRNMVHIPGTGDLLPLPWFHMQSNPQSGIFSIPAGQSALNMGNSQYPLGSIWDTWSTHYEHDGIDNDLDGLIDEGTDGIDNANNHVWAVSGGVPVSGYSPYVKTTMAVAGVDDPSELEAPPPYRYPLRGIQIKIRAWESDTKAVREVTVVHEFLQE